MDMQIQWFGLALSLTSLVSLFGVVVLLGVGLFPVRKADTLAGICLAVVALVEGTALLAEWLIRGLLATVGAGYGWLTVWDVITVVRPLGHLLALVLVAVAALRLAKRARGA